MVEASLLDFVKTGQLGRISLGLTRSAILSVLGCPPLWGTQKRMEVAAIWRYEDIEICFRDDIVDMIYTDHRNLNDGGSWISIDPWIVRRALPRTEFEAALRDRGITFRSEPWEVDPSQTRVFIGDNTVFSFSDCADADEADTGLQYWHAGRTA